MGFGSGSNLGVVRLLHEVGEHAGGALGHAAEDLQVEVGVGGLCVLRVELARLVADELDAQPSEEGEHLGRDGVRVRTRVLGIDRGRVGVRVRVEVRVGVRVRVRDRVGVRVCTFLARRRPMRRCFMSLHVKLRWPAVEMNSRRKLCLSDFSPSTHLPTFG